MSYAERDLKAAKALFDLDKGYFDILAMYLSHQCAEKAIKAIFRFRGKKFPKWHNLFELLTLLKDSILMNEIGHLITVFEKNEPEIRYPDIETVLSIEDILSGINSANEILKKAKEIIG